MLIWQFGVRVQINIDAKMHTKRLFYQTSAQKILLRRLILDKEGY